MTEGDNTIGQRFGRLEVMTEAERGPQGQRRYRCRCDCGTEKVIRGARLRSGETRSCGCLARELSSLRRTGGVRAVRSYQAAHSLVRDARGRAGDLACVDCGDPAAEWSHVAECCEHEQWSRPNRQGATGDLSAYCPANVMHYEPRCRGCHKRYDEPYRATRKVVERILYPSRRGPAK